MHSDIFIFEKKLWMLTLESVFKSECAINNQIH